MFLQKYLLFPALFVISTTVVHAGNFLEEAGKALAAPVTAPVQVLKDLSAGRPANEIVQNQINIQVGAPAVAAGSAISLIQKGNDFINKVPRDAISSVLGPDWRQGYDILTASQRIQMEIAFTSGRYLASCAATGACGLNQLAAVPVAAAMRDAYKAYWGQSQPLDPQLINVLSRAVPFGVLGAARWVVGNTPNMTVPGFLNYGHSAFGTQHAVTLGNLMIFSQMPDLNTSGGTVWLLHELFHIEQYSRYSNDPLEAIDGFAVDYVTNYNGMENEAQNNALQRFNFLSTQFY
jgi:hypothetical protein